MIDGRPFRIPLSQVDGAAVGLEPEGIIKNEDV
jgi:hypothetical protein